MEKLEDIAREIRLAIEDPDDYDGGKIGIFLSRPAWDAVVKCVQQAIDISSVL